MRTTALVVSLALSTLVAAPAPAKGRIARVLEQRWERLARRHDLWQPFRFGHTGTNLAPYHPWGSTSDGRSYAEGVSTPFSARYSFHETWTGPMRDARWFATLVRNNQTGKVIGEIYWSRDRPGGVSLRTPKGIKRCRGTHEAYYDLFRAEPGFAAASRYVQRRTARIFEPRDFRDPPRYEGVIKQVGRSLVYQQADNQTRPHEERVANLYSRRSTATVRAGGLVASPWLKRSNSLQEFGHTEPQVGERKRVPSDLRLYRVPGSARTGQQLVVETGHGRTKVLVVE